MKKAEGRGVVPESPIETLTLISRRVDSWKWPRSADYFKSKRSRFMTLVQAATKSRTNLAWASLAA